MCSTPLNIVNPKYLKRAKQMHVSHRFYDQEKDYRLIVPCGHCRECLRKRRLQWVARAHYLVKSRGIKIDKYRGKTYFCTLSIAPENYKEAVKDPYRVIRRFIDRVRKHPSLIIGYSKRGRPIYKKVHLDYLVVVEFADGLRAQQRGLPSTYRMHFHMIFFECPLLIKNLKKLWDKHVGIAWISRLRGEEGISYCLKYMFKDNEEDQSVYSDDSWSNGKLIVSHGFGRVRQQDRDCLRGELLATSKSWFCYLINNFPYSVPRYWKTQLFSKSEIKMRNEALIPPLLEKMIEKKFFDKPRKWRKAYLDFLLWP